MQQPGGVPEIKKNNDRLSISLSGKRHVIGGSQNEDRRSDRTSPSWLDVRFFRPERVPELSTCTPAHGSAWSFPGGSHHLALCITCVRSPGSRGPLIARQSVPTPGSGRSRTRHRQYRHLPPDDATERRAASDSGDHPLGLPGMEFSGLLRAAGYSQCCTDERLSAWQRHIPAWDAVG